MHFNAKIKELDAFISPPDAFLKVASAYGREGTFMLESVYDERSTSLAKRFSNLSILSFSPLLAMKTRGKEAFLEGKISAEVGNEIGKQFKRLSPNSFENRFTRIPRASRGEERFSKFCNELADTAGLPAESPRCKSFSLGKKDPLHFPHTCVSLLSSDKIQSRFSFGPVGYFSYDTVRFFEKLPEKHSAPSDFFDSYFILHKNSLVFNHAEGKTQIITHYAEGEKEPKAEIEKIEQILRKGKPLSFPSSSNPSNVSSNTSRNEFYAMVQKAREYIKSGDIFQVVLSRKFLMQTEEDPISIYFRLRELNPSPYLFYLDFGSQLLVGASPEVHVRVQNGLVEARPIAGTRKRGKTPEEEEKISQELLKDEKEMAEHTMLVDLARNDLGRVCEFGTVSVPEKYIIEKYSSVQHIVSHVRGKLRKGFDCFDALRATFPAGTVSGAPKVRAMEIIEEMEKERRGTYGGVVGYFDLNGNMDTCITIRTIFMDGNTAQVQTGAGLVLDSTPEGEFKETQRKANSCIPALTGKEIKVGSEV